MVFYGLGFGLVCGLTFSYTVHSNIHLLTASSLVLPHYKYMQVRKNRGPYNATQYHEVEHYAKSVFKGISFFTLFIIPAFYMTYVKKVDFNGFNSEETVDKALIAEDHYATILKKIKAKDQSTSEET